MDEPSGNPLGGRPARSVEQIRSAVESIHSKTATPATPGPLSKGLTADERIVIASFRDRESCRAFQQRLLAAGIMSSTHERRRESFLSVDLDDRIRAVRMLEEYRAAHPDRPVAGDRRAFDMTIFGAVMGGTFAFITLGGEVRSWTRAALVMVGLILLGGLTGRLFDVSSSRYRRTGGLQFALGEVMVAMAMLAVAFLLWRVLSHRQLPW